MAGLGDGVVLSMPVPVSSVGSALIFGEAQVRIPRLVVGKLLPHAVGSLDA